MNNFTFEDDDETINVYLKNVSPTTPIFTINKSDISLEKYQNVQELMAVINKIFSDIDTSTLTKDDFSQKLSGGDPNSKTINTLHKRFRNLHDALKYAKTKSINVGKVQQESLSEMIRRVIKEEKYDKTTQEEVDTFYKNFYTAMNNLEIIQKLTKNDKFRIYIRKMDDIANAIIEITG